MSVIADKYGMTDEEYKKAIADGLISTSWLRREEIVIHYRENLKVAGEKKEAAKLTAAHYNVSYLYVYNILREEPFK